VAGLLHDVGQLVMMNRAPDLAKQALLAAEGGDKQLYEAERELFGFDHADVGGVLMRQWNIPEALCETVACHHDISKAENARLDAAIIHIADIIAKRAELDVGYEGPLPQVNPQAWEITGLTEDVMNLVSDEAVPMFAESWSMIQPIVRHA
jgi:HD-like signal output (HDOD) protein